MREKHIDVLPTNELDGLEVGRREDVAISEHNVGRGSLPTCSANHAAPRPYYQVDLTCF
jgi:hypothetical protein